VNDPIITVPNIQDRVTVDTGETLTDQNGNWSWPGADGDTFHPSPGQHCTVRNKAGSDMSITHFVVAGTPSNDLFDAATEFELAQTDTYRSVQQANSMLRTVYTTNNWLNDTSMGANVNINDACNAFWNGLSINMYRAGSYCNNMGRILDVVVHEYGHGVDQNLPGGAQDGGLGEYIGDQMAWLMTGDDRMGPYFFLGGSPVRDLDPRASPATAHRSSRCTIKARCSELSAGTSARTWWRTG